MIVFIAAEYSTSTNAGKGGRTSGGVSDIGG